MNAFGRQWRLHCTHRVARSFHVGTPAAPLAVRNKIKFFHRSVIFRPLEMEMRARRPPARRPRSLQSSVDVVTEGCVHAARTLPIQFRFIYEPVYDVILATSLGLVTSFATSISSLPRGLVDRPSSPPTLLLAPRPASSSLPLDPPPQSTVYRMNAEVGRGFRYIAAGGPRVGSLRVYRLSAVGRRVGRRHC